MNKKTNLNKERLSTDNYYKIIKLGDAKPRLVFDYEKMWKDPCKVWFLLSERALKGKTYGFKEFAQKNFLKTGKPAVFYKNLEVQVMKERKNYLGYLGNKEEFKDFLIDRNGLYYFSNGQKIYSTILRSVNGAYKDKSSRIPVDLIAFDELMDGVEDLRNDQAHLINTALTTYNDPYGSNEFKVKKIFFMSNFRTINSPLLVEYGVFKIDKEITRIYDEEGKVILTILAPFYNEEEGEIIRKEMIKDPITSFIDKLGGFEENYLNKNTYDILNNVIEKDISKLIEEKTYYRVIKGTKKYNHIIGYIEDNKQHFHIVATNYLEGFIHSQILKLNERDFSQNHQPISKDMRNNFLSLINKGLVTFQNLTTRVDFLKDLVTYR